MKRWPIACILLLTQATFASEILPGITASSNQRSGLLVSSIDLLEGLTPTSTNYSATGVGGPIANFTDGRTSTDGSTNQASSTANTVYNPSSSPEPFVIYTLPAANAPNGYDLSWIVTTAGGDGASTDQHYDLLTSTDGTHFISLSGDNGFAYAPGIGNGATQSTVTADDIALGTPFENVKAIEFVFTQGGVTQFREIDVNGSPSDLPEPGAAGVILLGLGSLLVRRPRRDHVSR